jgi:hypothetical protein
MLYLPLLHGAAGPWDEIFSLAPLVVGIILLVYLYRASRQRRSGGDDEAVPETPPGPGAGGQPHPPP